MHRLHVIIVKANVVRLCRSSSSINVFSRRGKCAVCKENIEINRIETWRNAMSRLFKDMEDLASFLSVVHQRAKQSSDEDERSSAVSKTIDYCDS